MGSVDFLRSPVWIVLLVYWTISNLISLTINKTVPNPYMDEVFHVPQAGQYLNGTFHVWDSKITTLPGTYLLSALILKILGFQWVSLDQMTACFRYCNLMISVCNMWLIYAILKFYMEGASRFKRAFAAFNIAMFPVMYFFSFLYYTDPTSTMCLLAMHLLYLKRRFIYSAHLGALSVFTRQTNIIWVLWHGLMCVWNSSVKVVEDYFGEPDEKTSSTGRNGKKSQKVTPRVKRKSKKSKKPLNAEVCRYLMTKIFYHTMANYRSQLFGYVAVGLAFAIFVVRNKGIVVGDKDAHQVALNFPQMGYFTIVYGFFTFPFLYRRLSDMLTFSLKHILRGTFVIISFILAAYYNTVAHPYLIADNRHYTFYVWKTVYGPAALCPYSKFCLAPCYFFVWTFIMASMNVQRKYKVTFVICCVLSLVPQTLLEFRYFIPAYLFARIPMKNVSWLELVFESILYAMVNAFTIHKFLFSPFKWPDSDEAQRFMW